MHARLNAANTVSAKEEAVEQKLITTEDTKADGKT